MIRQRETKLAKIVDIMNHDIRRIGQEYRRGPSLHFYQRIRQLRAAHPRIKAFLGEDQCCELLYATLVAWDMNGRQARMKDFADFCTNLRHARPVLEAVEVTVPSFSFADGAQTLNALGVAYQALSLMLSGGRLVSNAKCLHFMFPEVCLPMDRRNTLTKLYGNTNESLGKFREVLQFAYAAAGRARTWRRNLDNEWNTGVMKMVDNAILLLPKN